MNWLPWKYVVRHIARARGFVDPISVLARMHQFAAPAEVAAPVELLRAGVVFHARGLMNAEAIQHNLDWIWPFWVERQFDPKDVAFLPRAFSITHVNLTHRNWTAVGLPDCDLLPIVDPRGLLTPDWDGWSLDGWIFRQDGTRLIPSRQRVVTQELEMRDGLAVVTSCQLGETSLRSRVEVVSDEGGQPTVRQQWSAESQEPASLVLSIRPYNPEGVSFVHQIHFDDDRRGWKINQHGRVRFSRPAERHLTSNYKRGDVAARTGSDATDAVTCPVGMATAAAIFPLQPGVANELTVHVPLDEQRHRHWMFGGADQVERPSKRPAGSKSATGSAGESVAATWQAELEGVARVEVPDERFQFLHAAALRTLVLHTPGEVYPGPYTYKRFWVRDTVFILNAALAVGLHARTKRALPHLLKRQNARGYFHSQDGEWDSNGQALWLFDRYCQLANQPAPREWMRVIRRAADWIQRKRVPNDAPLPAKGLLPAGFSAEHLGPNDYYYWDDLWSVAGLRSAARMLRQLGDEDQAGRCRQVAVELMSAIQTSLEQTDHLRAGLSFPAAPERRLDAGAIGSVVASYPLQLVSPTDERLRGTIDFLREHCMFEGGFFQDMIHSGINPYLTLHIAQALLRGGETSWFDLVQVVAKLASSTGQWPEAIHPRTLGGCMGDGQHVWAAAEWLMAVRNMFVREEGEALIVGSGVPAHWHYSDARLSYGPTWTSWGKLQVAMEFTGEQANVSWEANWHRKPPTVEVRIPCYQRLDVDMSAATGDVTVPGIHQPTASEVSAP